MSNITTRAFVIFHVAFIAALFIAAPYALAFDAPMLSPTMPEMAPALVKCLPYVFS